MRINEDYIEIDGQNIEDTNSVLNHYLEVDEFCDIIDSIVSGTYEGERPDFENAQDAIYPVNNNSICKVISAIERLYGLDNFINLNWMDVSDVTNMSKLFYEKKLDIDISRWNVSNVTNMSFMFAQTSFNGDISGWNIKSLWSCQYMFFDSEFNQDISRWEVSQVSLLDKMFCGSKMNKNLSKWDVSKSNAYGMLFDTPMQNKREWWPKGYNG